jgi:hypothetical protein
MGYEVANGRKGDGEGRGKLTGDEESTNNGPHVGVGRCWSRSGLVQPWCLGKKMKELRDGLLLGLRRGRGRWGSGEARWRRPLVILR